MLQHSNKLCVVCISPQHVLIAQRKIIQRVDFQISTNVNRLHSAPAGKGKRDAQFLQSADPLCHVTCDDGSRYTFVSAVKGRLFEANARLIDHPQLASTHPDADGFLAIMNPNLSDPHRGMGSLLTQQQYDSVLAARPPPV